MNEFKPVITGVIGAGAISDAYLVNLTGQFSPYIHVKAIAANHIEKRRRKRKNTVFRHAVSMNCLPIRKLK